MRTEAFDFDLPETSIALRPTSPRDAARLLVVGASGALSDRRMRELPELLNPGDCLVVNDTKVLPARLNGVRERDGVAVPVEATLIKRTSAETWIALAKPGKRLKPGDRIRFGHESRICLLGALDATVTGKGERGEVTLQFDFHGPVLDEAIAALGHIPLPPYIAARRDDDERDRSDYQTVFAAHEGSVAAPTAGLHFTGELLKALTTRGIGIERVTLHVGAGTFLPVAAENTDDHVMHAEYGEVTADVASRLNAARASGGRIVPVGTTALRLLESASAGGAVAAFAGETSIFITPGYRFRAADALLTNFHLPRSTLFMLVSAFSGLERMQRAYRHAIETGYRFYSYGDACLLFPEPAA